MQLLMNVAVQWQLCSSLPVVNHGTAAPVGDGCAEKETAAPDRSGCADGGDGCAGCRQAARTTAGETFQQKQGSVIDGAVRKTAGW